MRICKELVFGTIISKLFERSSVISILSVSPTEEAHALLECVLISPEWKEYTNSHYKLHRAYLLSEVLCALEENSSPIVICEQNLLPGSWRDVLARISLLPDPPFLIVASSFADEFLWAEALNVGAYDVLAKPFDPMELIRVISAAWLHWNAQHESSILARKQS